MYKTRSAQRFQSHMLWAGIASILLSLMLPMLLVGSVSAGQLTARSVTLTTSDVAATDAGFTVGFTPAASQTLGGVIVQFCSNSPIPGLACTAPTGFDLDNSEDGGAGTNGALGTVTGWTGAATDGTNTDANTLHIDDATPDVAVTGAITIEWTNANLPTADGTFYARIFTYVNSTDGDGYTPAAPGSNTDDGGAAMAMIDLVTVIARVQEKLEVCVGQTNPTADCTGGAYSGDTTVDLDVLDSSQINESSDEGDGVLYMQITTNANSGVQLTYLADHMKVSGAGCTGDNIETSNDATDRCLDYDTDASAGTYDAMALGTEQFGFAVTGGENDGSDTSGVLLGALAAPYDDQAAAGEYSFTPSTSTPTSILNTSGVVDSEQINMDFAATINLTTPSGLYQTVFTFIATGTF